MKFDEIGQWSQIKLAIIRQYAEAYAQILRSTPYLKSHYIDGFCGAGESIDEKTGESIEGSPLLVLRAGGPFRKYYFIDREEAKTRNLRQLCARHFPEKEQDIEIRTGDCHKILDGLLGRFSYKKYDRILCLLDPYGLHLDWQIIKKLGSLGVSEGKGIVDLVINFSVMDMNRNAARRDPSKTPQSGIERMNRSWGDDSWRNIAYKKDLFGMPDKEDYTKVVDAFCDRLKSEAGFQFAPKPVLLSSDKNAPLYYLFFASHNKAANTIASYLFEKFGGGNVRN